MSADIVQERRVLDARSRHYEKEMRRAAGGLRASVNLVPMAAGGVRRAVPALPLIASVAIAGAIVWRLRARRASPILLAGGLLFDVLRLWTLRQPPRAALPASAEAGAAALKDPANSAAAR